MSKEMRFYLPLPLDVEPLLEGMMSGRALALGFRARSAAAGDLVAQLIRDEGSRQAAERARYAKPSKRGAKPPEPDEED